MSGQGAQLRSWLVTGFGVWFVVCAVSLFFGLRPHPVLLALLVAAVGGVLLLLVGTTVEPPSVAWTPREPDPMWRSGEDPRLALLTRLVTAHLVAHNPGGPLHRHLTALADQRLVAHHGVSRLADPQRAHALLGPELTALATATDPFPRLTMDQIDVLIDRIEEL